MITLKEKKQGARALVDELQEIKRDLDSARFIAGQLFECLFADGFAETKEERDVLAHKHKVADKFMNILTDYMFNVHNALDALDEVASGGGGFEQ